MNSNLNSKLLQTDQSVLLIVDIQEKFVPVIRDNDALIQRTGILIQAAATLGIPILVSEQYPQGLGHTAPELTQLLPSENCTTLEKVTFGCLADDGMRNHLAALNRKQIIVCGIEAHVCVNQTVHQLLEAGYQPHLIEDAISSRHKADRKMGLKKMRQSGAIPSTTEMALFELMHTARHPHFKALQALIK